MDSQQKNGLDVTAGNSLLDDQFFLLDFIMGTYLGPDVNFENPRISAIRRLTHNSSPYTSTDLGPSYVSMTMLENLYYYLLRKSHSSLTLNLTTLHKYLKGSQFTDLFPSNLHHQIWYPASFRIVKGIVLIDDPISPDLDDRGIQKFKSLTRVDSLKIDMYEFFNFDRNGVVDGTEKITVHVSNCNKRRREDCAPDETGALSLLPTPCVQIENIASESEVSIVVTGTGRRGKPGPPVGVTDVGVGKSAYYFRVALPGVRRDYCKFSCEIESNGKVRVRGSTTGGKTIEKPSRVFEMKFRQLCPPGLFTLSFNLPGPVDPRLFAPNFRSDGVFEGVIIKYAKSGGN